MKKYYQDYRVFDLYDLQQKKNPQSIAVATKQNGIWETLSIDQILEKSKQLAMTFLDQLNLKKGDKVAIISPNRTEWLLTDLALMQIACVVVPVYPNIREEDYEYILNDAQVKYVFVGDQQVLQRIENIQAKVNSLLAIYTFDNIEGKESWWSLFIKHYTDFSPLEEIKKEIKSQDLFTIVYTSGTTGKSKGVMLNHLNIVSNAIEVGETLKIKAGDKCISFLPLSHIFERSAMYMYIYLGIGIHFVSSIDSISEALQEVKPHFFSTVPRLLEKVYDKIVAKGASLTGIKRLLFFWALNLGLKWDDPSQTSFGYKIQLKLANLLIFNKWRAALGGNIKFIASGSAPLQSRLMRVFHAAQLPIIEGYGLSETSPVISVNRFEKNGMRIGTVGKVIDSMQVKIAADGEILTKGLGLMMGYYNLPEATKEAIDSEGWFRTGDIGELKDNFLTITDRKKEIFKTSGGKYIIPQLLENKFKESPFIEQIMVIGENEKHPAAFIQPNWEHLHNYCKIKKLPVLSADQMVVHPLIVEKIQKETDKYNQFFAHYEQIKKTALVSDTWSVDTGELTPTLKLKRKFILNKYQKLYQKIYSA